MLRTILAGDVTGSIRTLETLLNRGKELGQFVTDFTWYLRNLLLVKAQMKPKNCSMSLQKT